MIMLLLIGQGRRKLEKEEEIKSVALAEGPCCSLKSSPSALFLASAPYSWFLPQLG